MFCKIFIFSPFSNSFLLTVWRTFFRTPIYRCVQQSEKTIKKSPLGSSDKKVSMRVVRQIMRLGRSKDHSRDSSTEDEQRYILLKVHTTNNLDFFLILENFLQFWQTLFYPLLCEKCFSKLGYQRIWFLNIGEKRIVTSQQQSTEEADAQFSLISKQTTRFKSVGLINFLLNVCLRSCGWIAQVYGGIFLIVAECSCFPSGLPYAQTSKHNNECRAHLWVPVTAGRFHKKC